MGRAPRKSSETLAPWMGVPVLLSTMRPVYSTSCGVMVEAVLPNCQYPTNIAAIAAMAAAITAGFLIASLRRVDWFLAMLLPLYLPCLCNRGGQRRMQ